MFYTFTKFCISDFFLSFVTLQREQKKLLHLLCQICLKSQEAGWSDQSAKSTKSIIRINLTKLFLFIQLTKSYKYPSDPNPLIG